MDNIMDIYSIVKNKYVHEMIADNVRVYDKLVEKIKMKKKNASTSYINDIIFENLFIMEKKMDLKAMTDIMLVRHKYINPDMLLIVKKAQKNPEDIRNEIKILRYMREFNNRYIIPYVTYIGYSYLMFRYDEDIIDLFDFCNDEIYDLTTYQINYICVNIINCIKSLHDRNVIHLDIKLENI
jgi:serine/threonine protein kinase